MATGAEDDVVADLLVVRETGRLDALGGPQESYTATGLVNDTSYTFTPVAVDESGNESIPTSIQTTPLKPIGDVDLDVAVDFQNPPTFAWEGESDTFTVPVGASYDLEIAGSGGLGLNPNAASLTASAAHVQPFLCRPVA